MVHTASGVHVHQPSTIPYQLFEIGGVPRNRTWWPCASTSRRLRAGTSLSKFATQANAKAELNRRSQACEVMTGTGFRVAKKLERRSPHRRADLAETFEPNRNSALREMDGHEGSAPSTPVWKTGVCLSTPMPDRLESRARVALAYVVLQTTA